MTNHPITKFLAYAVLAVVATFGLAACGGDSEDETGEETPTGEEASTGEDGQSDDGVAASSGTTASTEAPQPELAVPALLGGNATDITVGGFIFENDGVYLLCETTTDTDPPECEGETIEISNGEVIDPSIFLGEPGSQYSDAEVVVTGDVADGVLTIG